MAQPKLGRILVVDDEPALLSVMEQYLLRLGYEVTASRSAQQAWKLFEAEPSGFSLVIADITMPEMSGEELLSRLLDLNPAIRILICSGYPFDTSTLPAAGSGHIGFLQKPFTPKMMANAIAELFPEGQAG